MIVITGAAGFIGSFLISKLNRQGIKDLVLVDDFSHQHKMGNLSGKVYSQKLPRDSFAGWLDKNHDRVIFIFHLGARTDTAEKNTALFERLNLNYSKNIWKACVKYHLPIVYASSAATYGAGKHGYDDRHDLLEKLKPLNPYGKSKHDFDRWALGQSTGPPFWAGLKLFNVYGPNEYHKGRMASAILHLFRQIRDSGEVKLFRSHLRDIADGEQRRDFIYVKDVLDVCMFLKEHQPHPGIYNLGTGHARSFTELASAIFNAMGVPEKVKFTDTPENIRDNYQYFTEANIEKLRAAGYKKPFYSLEEGVADYVNGYLTGSGYY